MARRKGIRKSQDNNVPGAPGATPFRPMNGAGPGQRDQRSAGQDGSGGMGLGNRGAQIQPFPGGRNGGDDNLPGFGGQFPGGGDNSIGDLFPGRGDNSIGIPRGEVGTPFDGNMPPQSPGGRPAPSKGRGRGGRPQRPPGRGMPSGGPGLSRPQFPGMNIPGAPGTKMPNAPGMNINQTFNGDQNTINR